MGSRVAVVVGAVTAGPVSFRESGPVLGHWSRVAFPAGCRVHATRRSPAECIICPLSGYISVRDTRCLCAAGSRPGGTWAPRVTAEKYIPCLRMRFRLWRTAPGVGNAKAWVCVALSDKALNRSQTDLEAGGTTRRRRH